MPLVCSPMGELVITAIAAIAAIAAAVAAIGSWQAAAKANSIANEMAVVERSRRHEELTPKFEVSCTASTASEGYANLHLRLSNGGVDQLDQVTATILDETDQDHWAGGPPSGMTLAQARAFVWGPWEFNTGASEQVVSNRESRPLQCSRVGGRNWILLSLTRTRPGSWMTGLTNAEWKRDHPGPLRLHLDCRSDGYEPWSLIREVEVTLEGPVSG